MLRPVAENRWTGTREPTLAPALKVMSPAPALRKKLPLPAALALTAPPKRMLADEVTTLKALPAVTVLTKETTPEVVVAESAPMTLSCALKVMAPVVVAAVRAELAVRLLAKVMEPVPVRAMSSPVETTAPLKLMLPVPLLFPSMVTGWLVVRVPPKVMLPAPLLLMVMAAGMVTLPVKEMEERLALMLAARGDGAGPVLKEGAAERDVGQRLEISEAGVGEAEPGALGEGDDPALEDKGVPAEIDAAGALGEDPALEGGRASTRDLADGVGGDIPHERDVIRELDEQLVEGAPDADGGGSDDVARPGEERQAVPRGVGFRPDRAVERDVAGAGPGAEGHVVGEDQRPVEGDVGPRGGHGIVERDKPGGEREGRGRGRGDGAVDVEIAVVDVDGGEDGARLGRNREVGAVVSGHGGEADGPARAAERRERVVQAREQDAADVVDDGHVAGDGVDRHAPGDVDDAGVLDADARGAGDAEVEADRLVVVGSASEVDHARRDAVREQGCGGVGVGVGDDDEGPVVEHDVAAEGDVILGVDGEIDVVVGRDAAEKRYVSVGAGGEDVGRGGGAGEDDRVAQEEIAPCGQVDILPDGDGVGGAAGDGGDREAEIAAGGGQILQDLDPILGVSGEGGEEAGGVDEADPPAVGAGVELGEAR